MISGSHLLSHVVSNIVPSAARVLTVVFGMGTGVSLKRIGTGIFVNHEPCTCGLFCPFCTLHETLNSVQNPYFFIP